MWLSVQNKYDYRQKDSLKESFEKATTLFNIY